MRKNIRRIIILVLLGYSAYQLLNPVIPREEAITKAKEYVHEVSSVIS